MLPVVEREVVRVLPRGRHAAPREVVRHSQRERLLEATASAVAERGYARTSVADVLELAGVSRRTFYEHFAHKQACFLAAYDLAAERALGEIEAAVAAEADPFAATAAGVRGYLHWLSVHPAFARTFLVEVLAAGPEALRRRAAMRARFTEMFARLYARSRNALPELPPPQPARFRACVGAVDELILDHLERRGPEDLAVLAEPVLDVLIGLLVGHETARRLRAAPSAPKAAPERPPRASAGL